MDIKPDNQKNQSISDDQELAKVLAGVSQNDDDNKDDTAMVMPQPPTPMPGTTAQDTELEAKEETGEGKSPVAEPTLPVPSGPAPMPSGLPSDLDSIKQAALGELRPLVDKLDVSPEEKFDTYLLLLRSTDDRDLIAPAHEAAKSITDEARKAQALLDIIKEIDFLSQNQQAQ